MKFTQSTTTLLVLITMLLAGGVTVIADDLSYTSIDNFETGPDLELEARYKGLEGYNGEVTSKMAVVPLPVDNQDDLDGDSIEDLFELELAPRFLDEVVEAIIWVEERIDAEFLYFLEQNGAKPYSVTHGVESVAVHATKAVLYDLTGAPGMGMIYMNHPVTAALDTSVPVIKASQSQLENAGYPEIDGTGITVTIIDTGVDGDHRTFPPGKIIAFKDYNGGRDDLDPTNGMNTYDSNQQPHGTMTSSVATGTGGGAKYVGSAPGAYLIVIRVSGSSQSVANAVQWSVNNRNKDFNKDGTPDGPDIISMSLGTSPNNYMDNICTQGVTAGISFFTSAGNSGPGSSTMTSPARAKEIIAVGAINDNKNVWYYSSRGPGAGGITKPDVMAPGVQVTVAYPGNRWITTSGTSFSCPMTAGVGALILQLKPDMTPAEMMQVLKATAEDRGASGPDNNYGWGVVNTIDALNSIPTIRSLSISEKNIDEDVEVFFDAKTSGDIVKFEWDFDGDDTFDFESYGNAVTSHVYTSSGIYEVKFQVTSADSKILELTDVITVSNVAPELDVKYGGGNVNEDDIVSFNVSATSDTPTDFAALEYSWDFGDGTILDTTDTLVTHAFKNKGSYNVDITVTDDDGASDSLIIQMMVSNVLPVADAGENRDVDEDEPIFFTAEDSYDTSSDQGSLNYTWEMGDGKKIYVKDFYYSYSEERQYTVSLTVRDDDGGQDKTFIHADVSNVRPTAEIVEEDMEVLENDKISLHGIVNDTASDLELLEYYWDFDDGSKSEWDPDNLAANHVYLHHGKYNVKFKVKDNDGVQGTATIEIEVANVAPEAIFTMNKLEVWEDEPVYFDAGASTDTVNDYPKLEYNWDFDDGEIGTGKSTEHVFRRAGLFLVSLTVVDDDNEESIMTQMMTVMNILPKAVPSVDRNVAYPGDTFNFSGKSSFDSSTDLRTLVYSWDLGDGNIESGRDVQHFYTSPGDYAITLTVSDNDGGFHSETLNIQVLKRPEATGVSSFLDPGSTEGLLTIVVIMMVLVLLLLMTAIYVSRNRKRQKRLAQMGLAGSKKRRRKTIVTKPTDPRIAYMQDQQAQMAAYGLPAGQHYQYDQGQGMSVQPQSMGGMGMHEAQAFTQLPASTQQVQVPYQHPMQQQYQQPQPGEMPIYTGEVYQGEVATEQDLQAPQVPQLPAAPVGVGAGAGPADGGLSFKRPEPAQGEGAAEEPGDETAKNFCGNCGTTVKESWFICPSCREML